MDGGIATVLAAVVVSFGTLVGMFYSMWHENRRDHGIVSEKLDAVNDGVARVETKIDSHIVDHAKGML